MPFDRPALEPRCSDRCFHDLRTPLTAIGHRAQFLILVLERSPHAAHQHDLIRHLHQIEHQLGIVRRQLDAEQRGAAP